ncbi:MAG TPA: thiazole synthase [Planctomycetota bacterium]|nr:thiazole synthase [Planctomycetota bacterium]
MLTGDSPLALGPHRFDSRLFVGTGKYETLELMRAAIDASGSECVTVAVRRLGLGGPGGGAQGGSILDHLDLTRITLLPNTAGCFNAADAVRTARLAREALDSTLVKLEVLADPQTLLPDPVETLAAARTLVAEGFHVLAYTSDDPVIARRLEEAGCTAVMPLGAPIGSGLGILNPRNIAAIKAAAGVPIIVDAGVGTASDVSVAFELGVDGVLLNTGIALADDPVLMATAMRHAWLAGRAAFLAGRMPRREQASPSSPAQGLIAPSPAAASTPAPPPASAPTASR